MCKQNNSTDAGLHHKPSSVIRVCKMGTLSLWRLEDIGMVYKRVKLVDVSGIDDGYLALLCNSELRLCGWRRHRVGVSKVFVRFERQLHITLIVGIMWLLHEIVLCNKAPQGSVTVLGHVLLHVRKEDGNFEQLITFRGIAQINGEE